MLLVLAINRQNLKKYMKNILNVQFAWKNLDLAMIRLDVRNAV